MNRHLTCSKIWLASILIVSLVTMATHSHNPSDMDDEHHAEVTETSCSVCQVQSTIITSGSISVDLAPFYAISTLDAASKTSPILIATPLPLTRAPPLLTNSNA